MILFLFAMFYNCVGLGVDETRSFMLLLFFLKWSLARHRPGSKLTPGVPFCSVVPTFYPTWGREKRLRSYRFPRQFHLRKRITRRNPRLVLYFIGYSPWDPQECKTHTKYKWISDPRMTYGFFFDEFCASLDPGLDKSRNSTRSLGDWNKKKETDRLKQGGENGCGSPAQILVGAINNNS